MTVTGRSRSTKKSWNTLMLELLLPSAPCAVDAIIAIRHVVIESASGIVVLATPSLSVMISGLMYNASGKYERTRGATEPDSSFSFTSVALLTATTSARSTATIWAIGLAAAGGARAKKSTSRVRNGAPPMPPITPPMTPPIWPPATPPGTPPATPNPTLKSATIRPISLTATIVPECSWRSKTESTARSRGFNSR